MTLVPKDVDILKKDVDILVLVTQDVDILRNDVDILTHIHIFFHISTSLMLVVKSLSRLKKISFFAFELKLYFDQKRFHLDYRSTCDFHLC